MATHALLLTPRSSYTTPALHTMHPHSPRRHILQAAEEHSAEVMADVVSATENQLQDAEHQSTEMMARVLSATDKQVDVEEVSRPGTSTSEQVGLPPQRRVV
jgi:hypothetical protein